MPTIIARLPPADVGTDGLPTTLANAVIVNPASVAGLTDGQQVRFVAIGEASPVFTAVVASGAYGGTGGTVTVTAEDATTVTLQTSGYAAPGHNGTFTLQKADVETGLPIFLVDPISSNVGSDYTATPGLVLAPSNDPPEITRQWFGGTDTVARASGTTYTLPAADDGLELRYVEIAANVAGATERGIVAQQEVVAAVQPAVTLAAGTILKKAWPYASSTNWLYHANISLPQLPTSNASFIDLFNGDFRVIYMTNGSVSVQRLARTSGNIFNIDLAPPGAFAAGDRVSMLFELDTGTANAARAAYKRNDAPWVMSFDGAIP
ncbi:hypothetical protein, partial [Profundibacterium mesophilum]